MSNNISILLKADVTKDERIAEQKGAGGGREG